MIKKYTFAILIPLTLAGCASYPRGPSMMVLPGATASFEQFRYDDMNCKTYADGAVNGSTTQQAAEDSAINSAAAGTVLGAAAGALIGAAAGDPGAGAAIGAGSGLLLGGAAGTDAYSLSGSRAQNAYDNAYVQCMYARGHQVPVPASIAAAQQTRPPVVAPTYPSPGGAYPPQGLPPPPGY